MAVLITAQECSLTTPPNSWTRQVELQSFLNVNGNRTSNKVSQQSNRKKTPRKKLTPINPWSLIFYVWICGGYYKFSTTCYCYFFGWFARFWTKFFNLFDNIQASHDISKINMFSIKKSTVRKNCNPLVCGPDLAILKVPASVCYNWNFLSA